MKLNGKTNIITDKDITITDERLGDSLSEILHSQQEDISKLKSNIKWIYKYGGVGSGSGSGGSGGGSTRWSINAMLDGQQILSGNTIALDPNRSVYTLTVKISGGSEDFNVVYQTAPGVSNSIRLNADNKWTFSAQLTLTQNNTISISADNNSEVKTVSAQYIVKPYVFDNILLKKNNGDAYSLLDVEIETAQKDGLILSSNYDIAVNAQTAYWWEFNGNQATIEHELTDRYGEMQFEIPSEILHQDNAGLYSATLHIRIAPEGQTAVFIERTISFNLIPATLYLKIEPTGADEMIYDAIVQDGYYKYKANNEISFNCIVYQGAPSSRTATITYKTESLDTLGEEHKNTIYALDGTPFVITFKLVSPGWHKLIFEYTLQNTTRTTVKYLYCYQVESNYKWFYTNSNGQLVSSSDAKGSVLYSNYFRIDNSENFGLTENFVNTINNEDVTYSLPRTSTSIANAQDILINIGIQYNSINNVNNPILSVISDNQTSLSIFQNKVVIGQPFSGAAATKSIFLKKEHDYNVNNAKNFHLITFSYSKVYTDPSTNNPWYQCNIYIDGKLERSFDNFNNASRFMEKVVFHPGNYCINLFDLTYLHAEQKGAINDIDVNYYYNTYKIFTENDESAVSQNDTEILFNFYDLTSTYSLVNNLVKVQPTLYNNIATRVDVPTLVLRRDKKITSLNNADVLKDWLNPSWKDTAGQTFIKEKIPVTVLWGTDRSNVTEIKIDPQYGPNTYFYIQLQGSSTLRYKSKNLTLGIETEDTYLPVLFSPNYKANDNSTFLHESSFTLKADVVDSSHSNNTSVGKFVNENNTFNYSKGQSNVDEEILNHTKQCLEGFPILVYLELTEDNDASKTEVYYLGVYNFNLGRDSHNNLGYCDLSVFNGRLEDVSGNNFSFVTVPDRNPVPEFIAAEVQDNKKYWDFSQFDQSVLFKNDQVETDSEHMFGDIVRNTNNVRYKANIQDFVRQIAFGGGYLFTTIGKELRPVNDELNPAADDVAYKIENVVPDYKVQYIRNGNEYTANPLESGSEADYTDLAQCILDLTESGGTKPVLNYDSALHYYVTCMAFGLVDSVQKNLNIKTWDGKTFGLFFYDMDTSLGRSNSGSDVSYFCFTDFWDAKVEEVYDEDGNLVETINQAVKIKRDYFDNTLYDLAGYDIASSYLFAIPKYSTIFTEMRNQFMPPQELWGKLRSQGGALENADKFIDKYYAKNLAGIPDCLLNLNYRNKYLTAYSNNAFEEEANNLTGTNIEKTRDWLNSRLHILDAYFNLTNESVEIYRNNDTVYTEPINKAYPNVKMNPDVYVLKDIFTRGETLNNRAGICNFKVKAEDYSPLMIQSASSYTRYLLKDSNTQYSINFTFSGNSVSQFGGSSLWTEIEDITPFITSLQSKDNFYCNSEKIETLVGTRGVINNTWNLSLPSVKTISLTSAEYSGALHIDDSFYNLKEIDISNSKISLSIEGSNVQTVNLSKINSDSITFSNCGSLQNVIFNVSKINQCRISPMWTSNVDFSGCTIKNLTINGNTTKSPGLLVIKNSSALEKLNATWFESINVDGCTSLTEIVCGDAQNSLTRISAVNCSKLKTIDINSSNISEIDLSGCVSLETLIIRGNSFDKLKILNLNQTKVTSIEVYDKNGTLLTDQSCLDLTKFENLATNSSSYFSVTNNERVVAVKVRNVKDTPVFLNKTFQGCKNLERIYGNVVINVASCFKQCNKFSIHGFNLPEVKWKGRSVLVNGVVKLPYELLDLALPSSITDDHLFWDDDLVTNMSLAPSRTSAASMFEKTGCTVFDYYYFFNACPNMTSAASLFLDPTNEYGMFNWYEESGKEINNSPNRYMFVRNSKLTSISGCFMGGKGKIKLYSPDHDDYEVTSDNGLFSPLASIKSIDTAFYGYTYCCDRFIFRRKEGKYTGVTTLQLFKPELIVNNANSITLSGFDFTFADIFDADNVLKQFGNLTDVFKDMPSIENICAFYDTIFINYDESDINLPASVTSLQYAFVSTHGVGELNFDRIFINQEGLAHISQSFMVKRSTYRTVKLYLNNSTFAKMTNIVTLGNGRIFDSNFVYTGKANGSFTGDGIEKIINESDFPYNIFQNNTKLTNVVSMFENAVVDPKIGVYSNVKLPGNMFKNTPNLTQCAGVFYNMQVPYTLTETGKYTEDGELIDGYANFINCSKLKDVSYLFGQAYDNTVAPKLTGSIPKRLFYHGDAGVSNIDIVGTNKRYWDEENREWVYGKESADDVEDIQTITVNYNIPNATIESMYSCFQHCGCDSFKNLDINLDVEPNPNYSPFLYIQDGTRFIQNQNVNNYEYLGSWFYDGINKPTVESVELWDEVDDSITDDNDNFIYSFNVVNAPGATPVLNVSGNYCSPPDLLRYCTDSADVSCLFAFSGVTGWSSQWNGSNNQFSQHSFGLSGRICPYLLRPVPNTTDITRMFYSCKNLSHYTNLIDNEAYMIPKNFFEYAPKVTILTEAFADIIMPNKSNLTPVFAPLKGTLNVEGLFKYTYWASNSNNRVNISEVFVHTSVSRTRYAFMITDVKDDRQSREVKQYITFNKVFNQRYTNKMYENDDNYSYTFSGYSASSVEFTNKSLPDNTKTNNYLTNS